MQIPDEVQAAANTNMSRLPRLSALWLVPLLTLVAGLWMVYDNKVSQGPLITIEFSNAAGLEAGVTLIKTRDVEVGRVEAITLGETLDSVFVSARMESRFRDLLTEDSRFWVVKPRVTLSGITGLGTLLGGQYIQFSPGKAELLTDQFHGLDELPVTPLDAPGMHLRLVSDGDYSFTRGDVIHHQGIEVGRIENLEFDFFGNRIYYDAFIEAPYHQLVNGNTRFWNASGLHAELTSDGLAVDTGALSTLLLGGLSFSTPDGDFGPIAPAPVPGTVFPIYSDKAAINEPQFTQALRFWVLVDANVSGLGPDSRVVYRGLQIGRVVRSDFIPEGHNLLEQGLEIPILIEINPGRLGLPDTEAGLQRASADITGWIGEGLSATVKAQNILIGQQMVELGYSKTRSNEPLRYYRELVVIPTDLDSILRFASSIEELVAKLNALPLEATLLSVGKLADEAGTTLAGLQELVASGQQLIEADRNDELFTQLQGTLVAIEQLAAAYSDKSRTSQQLDETLGALTSLAEELRPLAVDLRNRPSSLVYPSRQADEPQPQRKQP